MEERDREIKAGDGKARGGQRGGVVFARQMLGHCCVTHLDEGASRAITTNAVDCHEVLEIDTVVGPFLDLATTTHHLSNSASCTQRQQRIVRPTSHRAFSTSQRASSIASCFLSPLHHALKIASCVQHRVASRHAMQFCASGPAPSSAPGENPSTLARVLFKPNTTVRKNF